MNESILLNQLKDYFARHQELPSISAMSLLCSKPKDTIQNWVQILIENQFLYQEKNDLLKYYPTPKFLQLSLLNTYIPAGTPTNTFDESIKNFDISSYLIPKPSKSFSVFIKGDSMIEAGIFDGDLAIIEQQKTPNNNDIVAALVDGAVTLKRLIKKNNQFILKAENSKYPEIIPKQELEIIGVLVGIIRKNV